MPPNTLAAAPLLARPVCLARAVWIAVAAGLALGPAQASAECVEDLPNVTCEETDEDGYDAGANDDLIVSVNEDAVVRTTAENADAIRLNNGNFVTVDAAATIEVTPTLNAGAGIRAGDGNRITNSGEILVDGVGGVGIQIGNGTIDGEDEITNADGASIEVSGDGARGIVVGDDSEIANAGEVVVEGDNATAVELGDGNELTNSGDVAVEGENATAVELGDGNQLTNTEGASIVASGDGSRAIVGGGATGNTITNGDYIGTEETIAIDLSGSAGTATNVIDNAAGGSIEALSATSSTAILGSDGVEQVTNRGSVTGDIDLRGGDDALTLDNAGVIGSESELLGGAGTDSLSLLGTDDADLLDLDRVSGFETLQKDDDGLWGLSGGSQGDDGDFTDSVALNAGALQLVDSVAFHGDFNQASGTTLALTVDPGGTSGSLNTDGSATLAADSTLELVPLAPLQTDTITVISAALGITGTFDTIPTDTTVLSFSLVTDANTLSLGIVRTPYTSFAETSNQAAVGENLDAIVAAGPTDDLADVLLELDSLSASQFPVAFDQLHPEAYDAHTGQMAHLGRRFAGVALEPRAWCRRWLDGLRPGQRDEVPSCPLGWSIWARALAGFGRRDTGSDFRASDHSEGGLMGGVDWSPSRNWVVSAWLGQSSTNLDVDDAGDGTLNTIEAGVASVLRLGGARARAALGYGRGDHEQEREVAFGTIDRTAEGEFKSNRIHAQVEVGWVFPLGNWRLEPLAGVDATWMREKPFDESGAGDVALEVEERENTLVATDFGGRIAYHYSPSLLSGRWPGWAQGTWTPELSFRWRSTWAGADREIDARFAGAPAGVGGFRTEAQDTEQGADVGAHLNFRPLLATGGGAVSIGYDGYFGDGATHHSFGASLRLYF